MTGNCYPFLWRGSQVWIGPVFLPLQLLIHWVPWSFGMKVVVVIAMGIQAQWLPSGTQMRPEKSCNRTYTRFDRIQVGKPSRNWGAAMAQR